MPACTFFGHRDCFDDFKPALMEVIENLIVNECVDTFYVGNQGQFDGQVYAVLKKVEERYPIHIAVVLAYMPGKKSEYDLQDTMLPEGIESVHPRYAVSWRNRWMLSQSDYVIAYVTHSWGGAAQFVAKAERMHKTVIRLP